MSRQEINGDAVSAALDRLSNRKYELEQGIRDLLAAWDATDPLLALGAWADQVTEQVEALRLLLGAS